jgi:hypothetical protein
MVAMPCSGPVALAVLLALPGSALAARTVALRNDPIAIRLEVHQPTAVVFPEAVAAVPTGADPARLSLDYDGPYLFLQPREPGVSGRLFVVGASGRLYGLRFTVATPADDMVTIEPPAASGAPAPSRATPPLDLLKALRFGTALPGMTATTLPPFQSPDARVQVLGQQALALDVFLGLVVTITNVHPEPLELDLRVGVPSTTPAPETLVSLDGWPLPPGTLLKAVAAEDERLGPRGTTRLYWLLERRP